jgi:hypothetical protein
MTSRLECAELSYNLVETLDFDGVDIMPYVEAFLKDGNRPDVTQYSISFNGPDKNCSVYKYTRLALALDIRDGETIVIIGFEVDNDAVIVRQIQGSYGV